MAKIKRKKNLNEKSSEYVEKNFLEQVPEGLPDEHGLVVAKEIPHYKKVTFLNGRDPGVALCFHYHSATHPLKHYTLYHGFEHDLPEEIIKHLESCCEPQYAYRKNPQGEIEIYTKSVKYIFQCRTPR